MGFRKKDFCFGNLNKIIKEIFHKNIDKIAKKQKP